MTNTHEWVDRGVASLLEDQQEVGIGEFVWWQGQIRQMVAANHVVFVESVRNLPAEAVNEKALLNEQGVQSLICVPVRVHGRVSGFFGVDSLVTRTWRTDQADLLLIVSGLISGVLERDDLEQELLERSVKDPLTGLYNRRYLIPRIEEMLGCFVRDQQPFALAIFDLDHFKQINDRFGHLCGDQILQDFASILSSNIRAMDVVARFGGEEFVVALPATSAADAALLVGRILDSVRKHGFSCDGQPLAVTASAGVVVAGEPDMAMGCEAMLAEADQRLYQAKSSGRDCLVSLSGLSRI
jgi:diguanylate cyclase (GGDEF)-like protein